MRRASRQRSADFVSSSSARQKGRFARRHRLPQQLGQSALSSATGIWPLWKNRCICIRTCHQCADRRKSSPAKWLQICMRSQKYGMIYHGPFSVLRCHRKYRAGSEGSPEVMGFSLEQCCIPGYEMNGVPHITGIRDAIRGKISFVLRLTAGRPLFPPPLRLHRRSCCHEVGKTRVPSKSLPAFLPRRGSLKRTSSTRLFCRI